MKEKIIFAPGCNEAELLRTLARFGVNTLGCRVAGSVELARMSLLSGGVTLKENFVTRKQEASLIDSVIREAAYYETAVFSDSQTMADSLYAMRSLIEDDESAVLHSALAQGEFREKNGALLQVYDSYRRKLGELGSADSIDLIRSAVKNAAVLTAEIEVLSEYPLTPLEEKLLRTVSGNSYRKTSLAEFLPGVPDGGRPAVTRAYGISNETENIISYIFENNIPLDKCTVAITDTNRYGQMIYDLSAEYGFEVTFGVGLPILNSNPARVLKAYSFWNGEADHSAFSLRRMIFSDAFDRDRLIRRLGIEEDGYRALRRIADCAGNLRLSADSEDNRRKTEGFAAVYTGSDKEFLTEKLKALSGVLEMKCADLISGYSKIRFDMPGRIDKSAVKVIGEFLENYFRFSGIGTADSVIGDALNQTVCSEGSREGALYVTNIPGALASMRPYLFVAGLSYDFFPGSPRENYIVLDNDYLLLPNNERAPVSGRIIEKKIRNYTDLLRFAAACGSTVRLSYPDFDLAGLKEKNSSSVLPDGSDAAVGFFDGELSAARIIGRKLNGTAFEACGRGQGECREPEENGFTPDYSGRAYSPSSIGIYFECPKKFFYSAVLGLKEPEEERPYEVISAKDTGTLFHSSMEHIANSSISKEELIEYAGRQFDEYLMLHTPLSRESAAREKERYLELVGNGFDAERGYRVLAAENELTATHASGVTVKGKPDRIEETPSGEIIIADYKTGRRINHTENDVDTCLQVLLYAFLAEANGMGAVSGCEYRYPRLRKTVKCSYSDTMKEKLAEKLNAFKDGLERGEFPCAGTKDPCKYCGFSGMCAGEREAE